MTSEPHGRQRVLTDWVELTTGATVRSLQRRPGGGRHEAWDVELDDSEGTGTSSLFLRTDLGPLPDYETYTLRREAEIYQAAAAAGIPVPAIVAVHPELDAVLMEQAAGVASFTPLAVEAQRAVIEHFVPILVRLHRADVHAMHLPSLAPVRTIREHVIAELDTWEHRLDASGCVEPFLRACFGWLRDTAPHVAGPPSLVQGDTGPGNFLHDGRQVTAILDFELAHLGDPMEDLAWIGTRNAQEPVPDYAALLHGYEAAGGFRVDAERIRYHFLFAELRIAVLAAERRGDPPDPLADLGNRLIYGTLHTRLTVEALASLAGVDLPVVVVEQPGDTDASAAYDAVLTQLRLIVTPAIGDPFALRRAKGVARVVKYLRNVDRFGDGPEQAELGSAAAVLGQRPRSISEARALLEQEVVAGRLDAVALLPYAWTRVVYDQARSADSMGVLATRHLPDLP